MRVLFIYLITLVFLSACSFNPSKSIEVCLEDVHLWEYHDGNPMWYTLSWFDGSQVHRMTVDKHTRSVTVWIERGKSCIFTATTLDSLRPMGGMYVPGQGDSVRLSFADGRLASLLLDLAQYDPSLIDSIETDRLKEIIPSDFDEDALYQAFLDGTVGKPDHGADDSAGAVDLYGDNHGVYALEGCPVEFDVHGERFVCYCAKLAVSPAFRRKGRGNLSFALLFGEFIVPRAVRRACGLRG